MIFVNLVTLCFQDGILPCALPSTTKFSSKIEITFFFGLAEIFHNNLIDNYIAIYWVKINKLTDFHIDILEAFCVFTWVLSSICRKLSIHLWESKRVTFACIFLLFTSVSAHVTRVTQSLVKFLPFTAYFSLLKDIVRSLKFILIEKKWKQLLNEIN